jgi:integrase
VNACTLVPTTPKGRHIAMTIRELMTERYAPLHNLSARSVVLFGHSIDRLRDFLEREPVVADFDDLTIAKFLRWRAVTPHRGRVCSPASVAKDKAHLSALWNFAARKRIAAEFPDLPRLKVPTRPPRGYTVQEVSAIIRAARVCQGSIGGVPAPWFWMTLVQSLWYTGERIGSHLRIRWSEADLDACRMTFLGENRKGGVETIQRQIDPSLAQQLRLHRRADTELVWPWLDNREMGSLFQTFRIICGRAGVKPRGFHAIRKASGSYVKAGGGDATDHLGHANPKTTRDHYLDTNITGQQSALDFLPPLDLREPPAA